MNIKQIATILLLFINLSLGAAAMNLPGGGVIPGDPSQEFVEIEGRMIPRKQLEEQMKQLDDALSKMTDAQRNEFLQMAEQLGKELEGMRQNNPEEFNKIMDDIFMQPEALEQYPQESTQAPAMPVAPEPQEAAKPVLPAAKHDEAIGVLNAIINNTNSFLNKIAIWIDFSGKLQKWVKQGKLKGWQPNFSWQETGKKDAVSIQKQLQELVHKLNKLKDAGDKAGEYKYLNDLVQDEVLFNTLKKLQSSLSILEPNVEVKEFGVEPVSKASREFIRKTLDTYIESLFSLNLLQDIDKIIAKYEPVAKKQKSEDEFATQRALEASRKPQRPSSTVVAGQRDIEESNRPYVPSSLSDIGPSYSPKSFSFDSSPSSSPTGPISTGATSPSSSSPRSSSPVGGPAAGGSSAGRSPVTDEKLLPPAHEPRDRDSKDSMRTRAEEPLAPAREEAPRENRQMANTINKISRNLEGVSEAIENGSLATIGDYMVKPGAVDVNTAGHFIPTALKKIDKALEALKAVHAKWKDLTPGQRKYHKEDLKGIYQEHKKAMDTVAEQIESIKGSEKRVSVQKRYAYLGGKLDASPENKELVEQLPEPKSVYELQSKIEEFRQEYNRLMAVPGA